ncbi:alpha/beta hydrolase [Aureibaculum sp. 2210JD6-5]|uniref:alpha/beta hydrolase n=1 Tax=Aureibaculum sp. 2210JD6-5 TaxID=3103957 RepID=UPI002AADB129|nr:alpha/beta hydrolase [Aureibaculum sp. 2210JD6-5]MDY7395164.1 alpha/beta hydrolase [Aureibaculum sp. 2210JD6-5]
MKKIFKIFGAVWIFIGIAFFIYMYSTFKAKGFDKSILKSDRDIEINISDEYIYFVPKSISKSTIFFYPGALVDPFAYSPLCRKLSENGYKTIIVRMPWRMATKGYNLIKERNLLTDKNSYTLIGHSQGGKAAGQFVYENTKSIKNLILLGTTHPRDIDLSNLEVNILKIYGSNDGVASSEKIEKNKSKLPLNAEFYEIKGGNHSQFGYYGHQMGDNTANITREVQLNSIVSKILGFLKSKETD